MTLQAFKTLKTNKDDYVAKIVHLLETHDYISAIQLCRVAKVIFSKSQAELDKLQNTVQRLFDTISNCCYGLEHKPKYEGPHGNASLH